ncbi:hypothetical protein HYH03_015448 [Edaphochlamys debaryana]|uniref:Fungal lipase-type domain-containing protein n=1 Tax=Edaphochlamys debaryana TaxID=47281 RepID=A0A835XLX7_9CHLO|nr:hypothetical protein HYH03_015448 [Edaphochlamys debaryana]|eukprot:KAG2485865.1 hypothetical protein HYH03_015448 [Edaphochlamys debaryana]
MLLCNADAAWVINSGCPAHTGCKDGTCLASVAYTTTSGCGSDYVESTVSSVSSNCRWTGCSWGGCDDNEAEVSSSWCWYAYDERCCQIITYSTCRAYLPCTDDSTKADPVGGVLSSVGVFDASATADTPTNALVAAILSNFVYESTVGADTQDAFDANFRSRVLSRLGGTAMTSIWGDYDLEAIVVETWNAIWVVFAGSESTTDFLNDFASVTSTDSTDFSPNSVLVGQGFYDGYSSNRDAVLNLVTSKVQAAPGKKLWMAGHSLGGAYAVLFAARAQWQGLYVSGVYTFGSPKPGDEAFASVYTNNFGGLASRTYRYDMSGDPVTVLPYWFLDDTDAEPTHVGITRSLSSCARRLLAAQPGSLSAEQRSHLAAELRAAEAVARAAEAEVGTRGADANRRELGFSLGSFTNHGILEVYTYYILNCVLSPNDRSNVPSYAAILGFGS